MPIIKSAIKRVRQEAKRRSRNRAAKDELRTNTKAFLSLIEAKDKTKLPAALATLQSQIDKAVKKNTLHKNTAARRKARFARLAKEAGMKVGSLTANKTTNKKPTSKAKASKKSSAQKVV